MVTAPDNQIRIVVSRRVIQLLLALLGIITLVAVAGYASFGLHPSLLASYPSLTKFYGIAFSLFGQLHAWAVVFALIAYLSIRTGFRWAGAAAGASAISLFAELAGTSLGLPFGDYAYSGMLGWKVGGLVPLVIPLSWFAVALPGYALASWRFPEGHRRWARIGFGTLFLLVWDLALDPAMSYLTSYWTWDTEGIYYGMPLINLGGWMLTGTAIVGLFEVLDVRSWIGQLDQRWLGWFYLIVVAMPLGMVVAAGLWLAAGLTAVGLAALGLGMRAADPQTADNGTARPSDPAPKDELTVQTASLSRIAEEDLQELFEYHSKTFSYAAWWFGRSERSVVVALYAFCRRTDDIVDDSEATVSRREDQLHRWLERARRAFRGKAVRPAWLGRLMQVSRARGMPFEVVEELVEGVRMDLGPVRIESGAELDLYTYRVASVVGIWMCYLFGSSEREVLRRASAMGRAMQLTNIVRDVGEDLAQDRVYIPADMRERYGVTIEDLRQMANGKPISAGYEALLENLMHRADAAYAYAFRGLPWIPKRFARAAAIAAQVYRGIHRDVRRNGFDNLSTRAYTRRWEKPLYALRGLTRLAATRVSNFGEPLDSDPSPPTASWLVSLGRTALTVLLTLGLALGVATATPYPAGGLDPDSATLDSLRSLYVDAVEEESALTDGLHLARQTANPEPVVEAYESALVVLKAKHALWPGTKWEYLQKGLPHLDSLVTEHPDAVEIRYLRLLSTYFLPRFLGLSDTVKEDFRVLARELPAVRAQFPDSLYHDMVRFVLHRGDLPRAARQDLRPLLVERTD